MLILVACALFWFAMEDFPTACARGGMRHRYGTSIQQGGVAARAGNTYDAVIARALNREVLNFGFANNGAMEPAVAAVIAKVDAAVIVIDCLPDMDAGEVASRTVPLVSFLRKNGHASTPIILVGFTHFSFLVFAGCPQFCLSVVFFGWLPSTSF
jgi:hypothetical protein